MIRKPIAIGAVVGVLIVISVVLGFTQFRSKPVISQSIRSQMDTTLYQPSGNWHVPPKSVIYNAASAVLDMNAINGSNVMTITEQLAPSQFTDIPEYFQALLDKLNEEQSFSDDNGTVYLTEPTELDGQIEAVLYNDGTLLFAHSTHALNLSQWRQFFASLKTV